jgi:hypothetical protein
VAAQFVEAACKARGGDPEATRAHIAHALSLLRRLPSVGPNGAHSLCTEETRVVLGGLPAWQLRRISVHVELNISGRIQIKTLARLVGLSASHFCRAFKCSFWGIAARLCTASAYRSGASADADHRRTAVGDCGQLWDVRSAALHANLPSHCR